jgi:pimeloyl-ACP methyl ester carboxylesterase
MSQKLAFSYFPSKVKGESGSQPTIAVFLGGILAHRNYFDRVAQSLVRQTSFAALTFDWSNHGDSPHTDTFSLETLADDLDNVLQSCIPVTVSRPACVVLVGHSLGGTVGMAYLYQHHAKLRDARAISSGSVKVVGLVVLDIAPMPRSPLSRVPQFLTFMLEQTDLSKFDSAKAMWQQAVDQRVFPPGNETLRAYFFEQNLEQRNHGGLRWICNLKPVVEAVSNLAWNPFMEEKVKRSGIVPPSPMTLCRVSFIFGEKSPYFPGGAASAALDIAAPFFDRNLTEVRVIRGADHFLFTDTFEPFMGDFLCAVSWVVNQQQGKL